MISVDFRAHPGNAPGTTPLEPPPGTTFWNHWTGHCVSFLGTDLIRGLWKANAGAVVPRVGAWRSSVSLASAKKNKNLTSKGISIWGPVGNGTCMQVSWPALLMEAWLDIAHEIHEGGSGTHGFHKCMQEHI